MSVNEIRKKADLLESTTRGDLSDLAALVRDLCDEMDSDEDVDGYLRMRLNEADKDKKDLLVAQESITALRARLTQTQKDLRRLHYAAQKYADLSDMVDPFVSGDAFVHLNDVLRELQ